MANVQHISHFLSIMKTIKVYLLAVFTSVLFVMCVESGPELSNVAIFVSPRPDSLVVLESGQKVRYELKISTPNDRVSQFVISSFDEENGAVMLMDSVCDADRVNYKFIYTAPEIEAENLNVELEISAKDNLGNSAEVRCPLIVKNKLVLIPEKTGITLYGSQSVKANALSFTDVSQTYNLSVSPDSLLADLYVQTDENFDKITWESNTGTKFVRVNAFNYAMATAKGINTVYQSSVRGDQVENIQTNDIILVGHGDIADGVFIVYNVIRKTGDDNDPKIQLGFKGVKNN